VINLREGNSAVEQIVTNETEAPEEIQLDLEFWLQAIEPSPRMSAPRKTQRRKTKAGGSSTDNWLF